MTNDWLITLCQYITEFEFYVVCILLLSTLIIIIVSPIIMIYYGLSGLTIKIKQHKKKSAQKRMESSLQNGNRDAYIMQLEQMVYSKPLKKKKKHK